MISSTTQKISYRAEEPPTLCRRFPPRVFQKAKNKEAACLGMRAFGMLPPKKRQGRKEKCNEPPPKKKSGTARCSSHFTYFLAGAREYPKFLNDPAAGSPTATLLRLLPCQNPRYRYTLSATRCEPSANSVELYMRPLRGSDGRCVQEPGTYSLRPDETRIQDIPRSWRIITSINPHHDSGSKDSPDPSAQAAS